MLSINPGNPPNTKVVCIVVDGINFCLNRGFNHMAFDHLIRQTETYLRYRYVQDNNTNNDDDNNQLQIVFPSNGLWVFFPDTIDAFHKNIIKSKQEYDQRVELEENLKRKSNHAWSIEHSIYKREGDSWKAGVEDVKFTHRVTDLSKFNALSRIGTSSVGATATDIVLVTSDSDHLPNLQRQDGIENRWAFLVQPCNLIREWGRQSLRVLDLYNYPNFRDFDRQFELKEKNNKKTITTTNGNGSKSKSSSKAVEVHELVSKKMVSSRMALLNNNNNNNNNNSASSDDEADNNDDNNSSSNNTNSIAFPSIPAPASSSKKRKIKVWSSSNDNSDDDRDDEEKHQRHTPSSPSKAATSFNSNNNNNNGNTASSSSFLSFNTENKDTLCCLEYAESSQCKIVQEGRTCPLDHYTRHELCLNFLRGDPCRFGDKCIYAHRRGVVASVRENNNSNNCNNNSNNNNDQDDDAQLFKRRKRSNNNINNQLSTPPSSSGNDYYFTDDIRNNGYNSNSNKPLPVVSLGSFADAAKKAKLKKEHPLHNMPIGMNAHGSNNHHVAGSSNSNSYNNSSDDNNGNNRDDEREIEFTPVTRKQQQVVAQPIIQEEEVTSQKTKRRIKKDKGSNKNTKNLPFVNDIVARVQLKTNELLNSNNNSMKLKMLSSTPTQQHPIVIASSSSSVSVRNQEKQSLSSKKKREEKGKEKNRRTSSTPQIPLPLSAMIMTNKTPIESPTKARQQSHHQSSSSKNATPVEGSNTNSVKSTTMNTPSRIELLNRLNVSSSDDEEEEEGEEEEEDEIVGYNNNHQHTMMKEISFSGRQNDDDEDDDDDGDEVVLNPESEHIAGISTTSSDTPDVDTKLEQQQQEEEEEDHQSPNSSSTYQPSSEDIENMMDWYDCTRARATEALIKSKGDTIAAGELLT